MMKTALFAGVMLCVMASQLNASDKGSPDDRCSNADLRGAYSFVADGYFGGAPFATAGSTTYDGRGGATGVIRISVAGTVSEQSHWKGTYVVDPVTCTATKTITVPDPNGNLVVDFFVTFADGFKELRFISTTNGATISGTARKQ